MAELPVPAELPLLGVPVGTILAYLGPLNVLPAQWQPCDGRLIADKQSPFDGVRIPNLMDQRFLMGVAASADVNTTGGTNAIPGDGSHGHNTHFVGYAPGEINYGRGPGHGDAFQMQYGTDAAGGHNHGGDNRPAYVGVFFIIRIK